MKTNIKHFIIKSELILMGLGIFIIFTSCGKSNEEEDAAGTFEATEVIVSSEAAGKILSFDIEEGQLLTENQLVGAIDSTQLFLRKQQILSSKKSIQSRRPDVKKQIAVLEQQISTARTERKRVENLLKANASTQKQLDDINAQIAVLEKQLDAQKTTLETANEGITEDTEGINIQVQQVSDQLKKCKISSPIAGTVLIK
ncbi:MAG: HlyD family secretion protein, partial [Paludibacter sp.]